MKSAPLVLALLAAGVIAPFARAGQMAGSRLAPRVIAADADASTLLAQRSIYREWGPSEDTTYHEVEVPGYRSEGVALALSAAVPGAGHYYVGEMGGLWYTLAEAVGWTALIIFHKEADDAHDDAHVFAGAPASSGSHWSLERWFQATQGDTLPLQQLYAADRDAFYHRVAFDDRYAAGWSGDDRNDYRVLENRWQRQLKRARYATGGLILNHVVSAIDALRAARANNLPLMQNLKIKMQGSIRTSGPAMSIAVERGF